MSKLQIEAMEFMLANVLIFCLCFYFLLKIAFAAKDNKNIKRKSPPAISGGWPLIGHLNLLAGPEQPHLILSDLADKYGPIFSIRLGVHRGLIVSSWEVAKECFTTNDIIFSNRPKTAAIQLMGYNFVMFAFSTYGPYWRELRKISMLKLLSNHRVEMLSNVRETEVMVLMKSMYESCTMNKIQVPVDLKKCFGDLTLNLMVRIISGSIEKKMDLRESENWREAIRDFFKMMGVLTISDVLPFLKWLDYFNGTKKSMKKTGKVMDSILQSWLEQHKKVQKTNSETGQQLEEDFMGEMMAVGDSIAEEFPSYDADTINKATCQTIMLGGTDSSAIALTWTLCLLLNNRHIIKRAQDELDKHVGRERRVKESDIENLIYIRAIIKETLRLYPPALLLPTRESSEDCIVAGYHIPAGTRLIINVWKLHRDPRVWLDPLEFKPERFITDHKDVDVRGQHFELLPFGGGRRVCPGVSFSLHLMEFVLANILHGFDIETPSNEVIDMKGGLGTFNVKATPLQVLLMPRLTSPNLYA